MKNAQANVDQMSRAFSAASGPVDQARQALENFNSTAGLIGGTMSGIVGTIQQFGSQMMRRVFMNAIREATQFIKQYDTTMRQIQAITFKTDEEMEPVRDQTIKQAIRLRTSTQNM